MTTTEKDIQHKIAEDMWHRDECFTVLSSAEGEGIMVFMRDETLFRIVVVKVNEAD